MYCTHFNARRAGKNSQIIDHMMRTLKEEAIGFRYAWAKIEFLVLIEKIEDDRYRLTKHKYPFDELIG